LLQELFAIAAKTLARGLRPVAPTVVMVDTPEARRELRLLREPPFPVFDEQLIERLRGRADETLGLGEKGDRGE